MDIIQRQPVAVHTLLNSLQHRTLSHAYLLQGSSEKEQKAVVTFFLKKLLCPEGSCDENSTCSHCKKIDSKNHPDIIYVESETVSIKIEQVRELQKAIAYRNVESDYKVIIIPKVDTMTIQGQNAMLKFIEEPGQQTIFFLLAEQTTNVLTTIKSRCQSLPLKPVSMSQEELDMYKEQGFEEASAFVYSSFLKGIEDITPQWVEETLSTVSEIALSMVQSQTDGIILISKHQVMWKTKGEQLAALKIMQVVFQDALYESLKLQDRIRLKELDVITKISEMADLVMIKDVMNVLEESISMMNSNTSGQMAFEYAVLSLQERER